MCVRKADARRVLRPQTVRMADYVARAEAFVSEEFPRAEMAFLGGSAAVGAATASSDLDVLILLPDHWADAAFVETTSFRGQIVEAFVYGRQGLEQWRERDREARRPVLDRMLAEGVVLRGDEVAAAVASQSRQALAAGPPPLSQEEGRLRAYALSADLDDLADVIDVGEQRVIMTQVWRSAVQLALMLDGRWLGEGKWLLRELRRGADRFGLAAWIAGDSHDPSQLRVVASAVLAAAGGYVQEGFLRGERPSDL